MVGIWAWSAVLDIPCLLKLAFILFFDFFLFPVSTTQLISGFRENRQSGYWQRSANSIGTLYILQLYYWQSIAPALIR
jgi:hypothetical protein